MHRYKKTTIAALCALWLASAGASFAQPVTTDAAITAIQEKFPLAADIYRAMVIQSANSDAAMDAYRAYGLDDTQINMLIAATKDAANNEEAQKIMASLFTMEELQEMHRYYTSPLSASIADKLEQFQQMIVELMQSSEQAPQIMNTLTPNK